MRERDIFIEALEKGNRLERAALLDETCQTDSALRGRVERLLAEHERQESFILDTPPSGLDDTTDLSVTERPGTVVGPYKLLQQIGEGGFGIVFMAEQMRPVHRTVAVKIIKPGMDTRQVIARFEAERQAVAMMDHPNIATVLDAGMTDSGRPYFVMELVKGVPITKYCDEKHLSLRERLELLVPVCLAVQHAHQKGVIHRDIKPTNVLVAEYDNQAIPKVIDFGVAKATATSLTDKTMFTEFGQVLGTMEYMSPEQAKLNQLDIDTRSDIYSLGVLLYELLTGSTPFARKRLQSAPFDEMLRIIREEEPPRPSTRLRTAEALPSIAANRSLEPKKLSGLVRGELDWIVMRALEKDRNRRYDTAKGLAADVERYLNDEAVQACPPSALYRFRKFARRNKAAVVVATVVCSALVLMMAGLGVSTVLITREQRVTKNALHAETLAKADLEQTLERERRDSYFHRITLAHRELSADNLGGALQLLGECPEDLRDWEWYYLMRLCRVEPVVLRDKTEIYSVAFSPDGERLASAGGNGLVKIWNSRTGQVIQTLTAHSGFVCSVAFHPDGKHLASIGADEQVKVWDLATGLAVFTERCGAVHMFGSAYAVALSPDGRRLAAGSDGAVKVWDWENSQLVRTFAEHRQLPTNVAVATNYRFNVAFSPDGRRLASGNWLGSLKLWDIEAGRESPRSLLEKGQVISALAFSRDGRLATATFGRRVDVWDTTSDEPLLRSLPHSGLAQCVAFSPEGKRLASSGEDKTVHIWDAMTGQEVLGLRGHTGNCASVAFSPDGRRLASASSDGTIRVWDATPLQTDEGQEGVTFVQPGNEIWSLAVSPDGEQMVSAGFNMTTKVWNARTGQLSIEFPGQMAIEFCAAWHPDNRRIASAGFDRDLFLFTVKVWDAQSREQIFKLTAGEEFFGAAFSPDGEYLVTGDADRSVRVWDARTGAGGRTLGTHRGVVRGVVFSRVGGHLASLGADGKVKLWNATRLDQEQDPRLTLPVRVHGPCWNIAFSPDGQHLATGGEGYMVKIWDVQTGKELHTMAGHHGDVYTVAFSPDGRWVVSAGEDSTLKVWDSHNQYTLARTLRGHIGLVASVVFSPDGRRLYSGSRDHTIKVWDVTRWNQLSENQ
jgi:WD40 repeat protein/serine/threonine protein kinase